MGLSGLLAVLFSGLDMRAHTHTHTHIHTLNAGMGLSGLLAVLFSGLDMRATIGGKHHYLLYCLAAPMQPRMLMTIDESGARVVLLTINVHVCVRCALDH